MAERRPLGVRLAGAAALARTAGFLSQRLGRGGGTTVPGRVVLALDPDGIAKLGRALPEGNVVVSATNGKTTTSAMLARALDGRVRLAHNRTGANLASGVASALLEARGAELGLFEVDEAALPSMLRQLQPRAVALGNLFRDQLDRYGELEIIAQRWRTAIDELAPDARVVVNVDDPTLADIAAGRRRVVRFGLDDPSVSVGALAHAADSTYCAECGERLRYGAVYTGHLGDWRCPQGHRRRPPLDVSARSIRLDGLDGARFELVAGTDTARVDLGVAGLYNVYIAVGAAALAGAIDVPLAAVATALSSFEPAFGRLERIATSGRHILLLLIKNPTGANEVVRTLVSAGERRVIMVALNDDIADGRDVSWIWDVDYEPLLELVERAVVSGTRAEELALRFAYGGFDRGRIELVHDLGAALDRGLELTAAGGELAVLPTYTAMLSLQSIIVARGLATPYWQRG
ncbi:MAG: MurT ligase domain-containing protein [Gaiellales bacterium]